MRWWPGDSGHQTGLVARHVRMQPGHDFGVSGLLASMACAIPYAVAAGCAFPGGRSSACRRWRAGDAARRILHRRRHRPAAEAAGAAERHRSARSSGNSCCSSATRITAWRCRHRLRQGRRGDGRARLYDRAARPGRRGAGRGAGATTAPPSSRRSSTRTSRCCPPSSPTPMPSTCGRRWPPARRMRRRSGRRWGGSRRGR